MHVVIMGCGRVGSALSLRLIELGHSVAIIDKDETAFLALGDDFTGQKVLGVGFDRDTLIEAGIEKAQAFAVTIEPMGGSVNPTMEKMVVMGAI